MPGKAPAGSEGITRNGAAGFRATAPKYSRFGRQDRRASSAQISA
jgi:hypothetical protein